MSNELREQILNLTDGGRTVFEHYLGRSGNGLKKFLSPFYDDTKAACEVRKSKKSDKWQFHDYGDPRFDGDCFAFVANLFRLNIKSDFREIMAKIVSDLHLPLECNAPQTRGEPVIHKTTTMYMSSKKPVIKQSEPKSYTIVEQPFFDSELRFWKRSGIDEATLNKFNVVSVKSYTITNREVGNNYVPRPYCSLQSSPIFAYKGERYYKVYRPNEKMRFMWLGEKPDDYCFGYAQLPECGTSVFITGGEKDVLSLAAHGFPAICLNSETAAIPVSVLKLLKSRFLHIILLYDTDETGMREMERRCEEHPELISLELPLAGTKKEKDITDYFAVGHTAEDFSRLVDKKLCKLLEEEEMLIKDCEVDLKAPAATSDIILSINNVTLGSSDNLLCVSGGEGTGKSHFVSGLVSGALRSDSTLGVLDTLGVDIAPNVHGKAVLHFDTEQSTPQLQKNSNISLRRAELLDYPDFYHIFYLTHLDRTDRYQRIRASMDKYYRVHGGIHLVVIDGVADLIKSANDENGSITIVEDLYRLARIFHACIICVVHFVPNGLKLRGHLGSELTRKASAILSIEKDQSGGNSVMKVLKVREGSPTDVPQLVYAWDNELNMFKYQGKKTGTDRVNLRVQKLRREAVKVFDEEHSLTDAELIAHIMEEENVSRRTARDHRDEMLNANIIKLLGERYHIVDSKNQNTE